MVCLTGFAPWSLLGTLTSGHKLRLNIPDTAIIEHHLLKAWLYTDKQTGVLHSTPRSQLSTAGLLHRLTGQHAPYELYNPHGWVAVAYFSNYITRLVNAKELQDLLCDVYVGAMPEDAAAALAVQEEESLELLAVQAYVIPGNDVRYITTFGGIEGAANLTQVRTYSDRFSAGAAGPAAEAAAAAAIQQAAAAAAAAVDANHQAAAAVTAARSSCSGSIISLSSQPISEGGGYGSHVQLVPAAAGGSSSSSSSDHPGSRFQREQQQQQQQQQYAEFGSEAGAAAGSEFMLQTSMFDQDGCATPTMPVGSCWRSSVGDVSSLEGSGFRAEAGSGFHSGISDAGDVALGSPQSAAAGAADTAGTAAAAAETAAAAVGLNQMASGSGCSIQAAPGPVARAAGAALQVLTSYLDKAHGLRVQGLVAEFIKDLSEQLWLIGLTNVSLDNQQSRGSSTTFTERWGEFLAGTAPPPAPHLAQHTSYASAASPAGSHSNTAAAAAAATVHSPVGQQSSSSSPKWLAPADGRLGSPTAAAGGNSPGRQLNRQFFPLLSVDLAALPKCRPQSADAASRPHNRPASAPRCMRATSPQPSPSSSHSRQRPGLHMSSLDASCGAAAGAACSSLLGSTFGSNSSCSAAAKAAGARYTSRNAASAARPGAGGNPTSRSSISDSYTLWMQQPVRPGDSVTAQLAGQLEWAKEQVQQYADLAEAARLQAHSATNQAAQQVSAVQQELLQLRHDAAAASRERRQLQQQVCDLDHQRSSQAAAIAALHQQLADVQEQLAADRATLATMLRQHQQQKQQLEEEVSQLQQQNGELRFNSQQLATRLDEESEVVSALRAQLVDYKLQMEQMQLQAKKGRSLYNSNSMALRRGGTSTPPAGQLQGPAGAAASGFGGAGGAGGLLSGSGAQGMQGMSSSSSGAALVSLNGGAGAGAVSDPGLTGLSPRLAGQMSSNAGGGGSWGVSSSGNQRRSPMAAALSLSSRGLGQSAMNQTIGAGSSKFDHTVSYNLAAHSSSGSRRSTGEYFAAALGNGAASGPVGSFQAKLQGQRPAGTQQGALSTMSHDAIAPQLQQQQSSPFAQKQQLANANHQRPGSSNPQQAASNQKQQELASSNSSGSGEQQQLLPGKAKAAAAAAMADPNDPDAAVAAMTAAISADMGQPLAPGPRVKPQLFIGDLLVGPTGSLTPAAEQQLAVISGLMQEVHGDLFEVFNYYALLGSVQVVADRVTMELQKFGRLAFDLHIPQDNKSLSAVEDVFYVLSDRRPCLALKNNTRPPSHEPCSRPGRSLSGTSSGLGPNTLGAATAAAAAAAAAAGTAYLGPGMQHAVARAAAWENMGSVPAGDAYATSTAAAAAAAVMASVLGPEVIVPEQFPEALIRLACVRYRWGVVNSEYDWDGDDDDESWEDEATNAAPEGEQQVQGSARMIRQQQQHQMQQQSRGKRGPKVLRPEGNNLYTSPPPAVAMRSSSPNSSSSSRRSPSPSRAAPEQYALPSDADDLVTVVRTFLQHEVLKYARRNKLAGSPLGHRRAQSKAPGFVGWEALPYGSQLRD